MMVACGFREAITEYICFFNDTLFSVTYFGAAHRKAGNEHEKNNELIRTETNSDSMSSYGVRTSSLLIFFIPGRKERKAQPQFRTRITRISRIISYPKNQSIVHIRMNHRAHREHRDFLNPSLCPLCTLWF